ncbi:MAG TPA: hypothetical protein VK762_33825 [Polyangiaceae bacterium]|jgi:hypothetical protein|nr:hypothetical protein [Polyangiaceae bacterium]
MKTKDATHTRANGADRIQWTELARRVKHGVSELQSSFGDRMKHDPYTTVGIAALAGIGVGIVLGSRILRTAVTSAVSYGIVEFARSLVEERVPTANGVQVPHVTEALRSTTRS